MDAGAKNEFAAPKRIKKEKINEDIKEFAESTMNELLGWYGYGVPRDDTKRLYQSHSGSNSSGSDSPKSSDSCGWCGKHVEENVGLSAGLSVFCSELCFSQSRRANFKKNKTCDWCRHVRHTVSYVDFQDGASQLQFCSDKCLNQYKMHLFCRETEAHLELHPHLHRETNSSAGLITPELWLKNCRSPSSQSPSPRSSPKLLENPPPQTSPLPLISIAHPSKLMADKRQRKIAKKQRKRSEPSPLGCVDLDAPQDLRVRQTSVEKVIEAPQPPILEASPEEHVSDVRQESSIDNLKKPFLGLPPVTVLVPYPVLLPLPLPIPIPIPLSSFLKAKDEGDQENNGKRAGVDEDVREGLKTDDGEMEEAESVSKPLRKRKKVVEPKSRIVMKKKTVAV